MRYKQFEKIKIDRAEISQNLLNIEEKVKNNYFTWNGQFSPQLVDELLLKYSKAGDTVLDPFLGSGTTVLECALLGLNVCGIELNPAAFNLAKIYMFCNYRIDERKKILNKFERECLDRNWIELITGNEIDELMRSIAIVIIMLNRGVEDNNGSITKNWSKLYEIILKLPYSNNEIEIINGDSRKVILPENKYDLVITSPPYINVYNYHQQYRKEMELLEYKVLKIAVSEIGSNRKNRTNRFYTVIQYCIDLALTIRQLLKSSKIDARLIFVIGRKSKVLGIDFSNSRLLYEIMIRIFRCKFYIRQERHFTNRFGMLIYEDILHFRNSKFQVNRDEKYITDYARKIACEYLQEKQIQINELDEKYELINNAILNAHNIVKSE